MTYHSHFLTNKVLKRERIYIRHEVSEWQDSWPLHTHDGYEIYYFLQGNVHLIIGNEIYLLQPGDMFLFSGDVLHRPNPSKDTAYIRSYINFTADYVQEMAGADLAEKLLGLFQQPNGLLIRWDESGMDDIGSHFTALVHERERGAIGNEFMIQSLMVQLLLKIYRKSKEMYALLTAPAQSLKETNVRRILMYLNQHYRNTIALGALAKEMHLNKYYMCHCFKEITGLSINNYITRKRIDEAKKLLRLSDEAIGSMSEQLGFSNPVHFSRMFKQYAGVSPQAYRKMHQT
ncbi:AraC-like ligand binding domain-containing protein [Paenibacillus sp. UNCCL117]|uniref:AraC family transcriptional regulator n=1 Tax=unclassified Paenibacillus TaxID=185978 RepID=UPI00088F8C3F|nr:MULTISPECIES: AraC family transcriptional regulator [unclassified Paenibacillus]SDE38377.1 AraC-like ligand binding domain-containing protein [Paenibacillus sp. cl123]SFW65084.1 AraC-like ligand binding domain-containing protein [Paenibacillus sp. UNCCL117]